MVLSIFNLSSWNLHHWFTPHFLCLNCHLPFSRTCSSFPSYSLPFLISISPWLSFKNYLHFVAAVVVIVLINDCTSMSWSTGSNGDLSPHRTALSGYQGIKFLALTRASTLPLLPLYNFQVCCSSNDLYIFIFTEIEIYWNFYWHWLIRSYRSQVHISMIYDSYIALCAHYPVPFNNSTSLQSVFHWP